MSVHVVRYAFQNKATIPNHLCPVLDHNVRYEAMNAKILDAENYFLQSFAEKVACNKHWAGAQNPKISSVS